MDSPFPNPESPLAIALGAPRWRRMEQDAERIARQPGPVLITGETGTGKSTLAKWIHDHSHLSDRSVVRWGCGEFDVNTVNAALFGHSDQAYTGAREARAGVFDEADGGTLILDDIDYLPMPVQSKLLRVLDDGGYRRLGEPTKLRSSDVRLIITTNKSLPQLISDNRFLPDFYYRLRRWRIHLPALRENKAGIRKLCSHYFQQIDQRENGTRSGWHFDENALNLLCEFPWKGNLRELRDAIENISLLVDGDKHPVSAESVGQVLSNHVFSDQKEALFGKNVSRDDQIRRVLNWVRNIKLTAELVGCSRNTVYKVVRNDGLVGVIDGE